MDKHTTTVNGNSFAIAPSQDMQNFTQAQQAAHAARGKQSAAATLSDVHDMMSYIIAMLEAKGYDQP